MRRKAAATITETETKQNKCDLMMDMDDCFERQLL